ncbi:energy transducer TonB [Edaphobacter sp. 4G125]|nr:energy transducer TonB [Edaphobacter sp. 4G125]
MTIAPPARTLHAIGIFDANTFERRVMRLTERSVEMGRGLRLVTAAACVTLGAAACASALALHTEIAAPGSAVMDKKEAPSSLKVAAGVMAGNVIYQKKPVYPPEAKAAHIEGAVVMKAIISKEGTVQDLQVVSGPKELRAASIDAVKEWKYKPYRLNGDLRDVETTITVNYSIGHLE